jgi:hypothetical protein
MIKIDETDPVVKNFTAESAKLQELQAEQSATGKQIDEKLAALVRINQQGAGQGEDAVSLAAQALLAGEVLGADRANLEKDLADLERKQQILQRAIELQRRIVDKARTAFSLTVNSQVQALHERLVLQIAKTLRELATQFDAEAELFDEITGLGAAVHFRPMRPSLLALSTTSIRGLICSCEKFRNISRECSKNFRGWSQEIVTGLSSSDRRSIGESRRTNPIAFR